MIGDENRGWYVAMMLLDYERSSSGGAVAIQREIERLIAYSRNPAGESLADIGGVCGTEMADRHIEAAVGQNISLRIVSMQAHGLIPNYEASMGKLFLTELMQRSARTGVNVLGCMQISGTRTTHGPRCILISPIGCGRRSLSRLLAGHRRSSGIASLRAGSGYRVDR